MTRLVLRALLCICALLSMHTRTLLAQLRPLEPIDNALFLCTQRCPSVHVEIGVAAYGDQYAALAGTRGRLIEIGNTRVLIRTGRVVLDFSGTIRRKFHDESIENQPFGGARTASADGNRQDAGAYAAGVVVRLTPSHEATLATLRFGTRLPTTDNRVGLDRDATDFFATLGAQRRLGPFAVGVEAGLGINGTRKDDYEQSDVLVYSMRLEHPARIAPFLIIVGQQDFHEHAVRGNEDLGELRAGIRVGDRRSVKLVWVHGFADASPGNGARLTFGVSL